MKGMLSTATACLLALSSSAEVITQWSFNSLGDADPTTGTFAAAAGEGSFLVIGEAASSFGSVANGASTDPEPADNTQLRLVGFPPQGSENKSAGVEFRAGTLGRQSVRMSWDQLNSNSASRFWRVQYTVNGFEWIDHSLVENTRGGSWGKDLAADFSQIAAADNNPNFGVRLVSEFESSAAGSGLDEYVAVNSTSSYSRSGTLWLDMVTLHGDPIPGSNQAPRISGIPDQVFKVNSEIPAIALQVSDAETPAGDLVLSYSVSDWTKIINIIFDGSAGERTMTIIPAPDETGEVAVTVRVVDAEGASDAAAFSLKILPLNIAPVIAPIPEQEVTRGSTLGPLVIAIEDPDTAPENLRASAVSSNPALVPNENISLAWSGTEWLLTLQVAPLETGLAIITLAASDGLEGAEFSFLLRVPPPQAIVVWDFNSNEADGDAKTGSLEPRFGLGGAIEPAGNAIFSHGTVAGGGTSDPSGEDRSMLHVSGWPSQGTGSKSTGIQIRASTAGHENIALTWDHYNSNTASRYWRIQYSIDGINFIDHTVYSNAVPGRWLKEQTISFSSVPGANDNPEFAVRILSEFESTATGAGEGRYVAVNEGSNYSAAGTLWMDMVALRGDSLPFANRAPQISEIAPLSMRLDLAAPPIRFTVSDPETGPENLVLAASAIPEESVAELLLEGSGMDRTLTVIPAQAGEAAITVRVTDEEGKFAETTFALEILPANTPPRISSIPPQSGRVDRLQEPVYFTIEDDESAPEELLVSATAFPPEVIAEISLGGSGPERTLTIIPAQAGEAAIIVHVTDAGGLAAETTFVWTLLPGNTAPIISSIAPLEVPWDTQPEPVRLTIQDQEQALEELILSVWSSDPDLIAPEGMVLDCQGTECELILSPTAGRAGATTVTIYASDGELESSSSFQFSVSEKPVEVVPVRLRISGEGSEIQVAWPTEGGWNLHAAPTPGGAVWSRVTAEPLLSNGEYLLRLPVSEGRQFFRLQSEE